MTKKETSAKINLIERPPVITVLGHVDHGKTSLLDAIRKTDVAGKESGGITQHIGAYQIEHKTKDGQIKKITFIDTPGHEAFGKMRSRGAKVADIAILVVAADDGVQPQTKESIRHIAEAKIPFVVALTKIDKPEAQLDRVKKELSENEVFIEEWGGKTPLVGVSAKSGEGLEKLLEMILLIAEMEELKADPFFLAKGIIIESHLDKRRGPIVSLIVKDGTLKIRDIIIAGQSAGKIKRMEDARGQSVPEAGPGTPVRIMGFESAPQIGEVFSTVTDKPSIATEKIIMEKSAPLWETEENASVVNIILKSDAAGSLEAVEETLKTLTNPKIGLKIIAKEIGDINESDVKLAEATDSLIIGFRTGVGDEVRSFAERRDIPILIYDIIYDIADKLKEKLEEKIAPENAREDFGKMKVLAIFKTEKNRVVLGGKISEGKIVRGSLVEITRGEESIGRGRVVNLQHNKKDALEVAAGLECGLLVESGQEIQKGDVLASYREVKKKITL